MIGHQPVSFQHVVLVFQKAFLGQLTYLKTIELAQHLSSGFFRLLEPHSSLHINNETLLSEVFTTHTDIVSVWWIN